MSNIINTAPCRFCGQMVQIDSEEKLTQPQAEEQATMSCTCEQAVEYQKEKQRNGVKWLYVVYKNIVGYASSKYLSK